MQLVRGFGSSGGIRFKCVGVEDVVAHIPPGRAVILVRAAAQADAHHASAGPAIRGVMMLTLLGEVNSLCVLGAPSCKTSLVLARPPFTRTPFSPLSNGRRPKVLCTLPVTPAVICARSNTSRPRVGRAATSSLLITV